MTQSPLAPKSEAGVVERLRELLARAIPGCPGYGVTEDGAVWSMASNWRGLGARKLIPAPNAHGYPRVSIMVDGRKRLKLVHPIVCEAFHGPKPCQKLPARQPVHRQ